MKALLIKMVHNFKASKSQTSQSRSFEVTDFAERGILFASEIKMGVVRL
jgi:hypothetical protein